MTTKVVATCYFAVIGSFIVKFLGGADLLLRVTCTMIMLDYITGLIKGCIQGLSSQKGTKGILKKMLFVIAIIMCVALDKITHLADVDLSFRTIILFYITGTEGISIIENLEAVGIKMPKQVHAVLRKFEDEEPN